MRGGMAQSELYAIRPKMLRIDAAGSAPSTESRLDGHNPPLENAFLVHRGGVMRTHVTSLLRHMVAAGLAAEPGM
jgi:hypothetical protein